MHRALPLILLLAIACRPPPSAEAEASDAAAAVADAGLPDAGDVDERDAGSFDAAVADGADPAIPPEPDEPDASVPDAAVPADAGPPDAAVPDAWVPMDAGVPVPDAGTTPVDAGPPPPAVQAFFNMPAGVGHPDDSLERVVKDLLSRAAPGSRVRVSLYTLTRGTMASALVAAQQRGVDVRVILDGHNAGYAAYTTLVNGLGASHVTLCGTAAHGSCVGTGINHSKFYLFSQLADGTQNVVVQSSANLSGPMLEEHNNLVVIRNDPALHAGYLQVWQDQHAQVENLSYYHVVVGDHPVRTYFFPRQDGDTVLSILDNVVCTGGGKIRVAMAFFTDGRVSIAQKLAAKKAAGCDVRVLLRDDGTVPGAGVVSALDGGGVWYRRITPTSGHATIHSKILLVDSLYDTGSGPTARKLVFAGSHNYTGPALTSNDEQMVRVDDATVFAAYWANWNAIRATVP